MHITAVQAVLSFVKWADNYHSTSTEAMSIQFRRS